ncbi:MAG TPA: BrnA antitoxin family protein [Terriglobales bacterium]|nr:BrnA antitoxin family protein [Terriglobales bacterium]
MKKKRKAVKKRRNIARLRASADGEKLPLDLAPEWRKYYKPLKKPITLRLDADVLAWFKKQGRGYQTRINRVLRKTMAQGMKI